MFQQVLTCLRKDDFFYRSHKDGPKKYFEKRMGRATLLSIPKD